MPEPSANGVRAAREAAGLSQQELANAAGLSRQSVGAIESGRSTPSVSVALRIAAAVGRNVEALFGAGDGAQASPVLIAEGDGSGRHGRQAVARIADRWVAWPLVEDGARQAADALVADGDPGRLQLLRPEEELERNVVMSGCALGMGILADRLNARSGPGRFLWFPRSNADALGDFGAKRTHVAGLHGEKLPRGMKRTVRVGLGRWEAGLLIRPDGTRTVRSLADLARPDVRLVAREEGAGVQHLLESLLRRARLPLRIARSPHLVARGHMEVARAVALGAADVGVATRDAALAFGLELIPLAEEPVELLLPAAALEDPRMTRMMDVLSSAELRRELAAAGYDTRSTGSIIGGRRSA